MFTNVAGVYLFLGSLIIGFRLSTNQQKQAVMIMFLLVFVGVCAGILLGLLGWQEVGSEKDIGAWTAGARSGGTNSTALLLVLLVGPGLFRAKRTKIIFPMLLTTMTFFVVAIMAQKRGATILACLAIFCCARTNRQRAIFVLVFISVITVTVCLSMEGNEYISPLVTRFTELQEVGDISRVQDSEYGVGLIWQMDLKEFLVGIPPQQVFYELKQLRNTGGSIHNGYLDIMVRYGAISALAFYAFWVSLGVRVLRFYRHIEGRPEWVVSAVALVVVFITDEFVGSHFVVWRETIVPGLLIGMLLSYIGSSNPSPLSGQKFRTCPIHSWRLKKAMATPA